MSDFSPTDAAFEGFRIIRDKPGATLGWTAFGFLWFLLLVGVLSTGLLTHLTEISRELRPTGGGRDWEELAARFGPAATVGFILSFAIYCIIKSAIYRAVLHPDWRGLSHLNLGKDELRVFGVELASLLILAAYWAIGFALVVLVTQPLAWPLRFPIRLLLGFVLMAGWVWWGVRLALNKVASYAEAQVSVFGSWALTRGRFWPLLGMFLAAGVMGVLLALFGLAVTLGVIRAVGLSAKGAVEGHLDVAGALAALGKILLAAAVNILALILQLTITIAPTARAYERIKAAGAAPPLASADAAPATA
ncbi:hypothetical protein QO010_001598 [Caulobacter ginsengisoli]|uniref:Glycerophosphoryl diester phosphodiesterase membrane domain-containing protein n=1 Tax=Caulobacter ginsengisoli TaxID=400775 RepID=A0ABU0IP92_9CAUL|nr:hypothetical protein [Caulobacter ginsengisoli]MDQ0463827.1 hypothetical protein [Caulobacter ginsengisoli]